MLIRINMPLSESKLINFDIRKILPESLRKQLVYIKWALIRIPYVILYYLSLWFKASIKTQVKFLPLPVTPPIYWTQISKIRLHGSLAYPPKGRLCMDGNWDNEMVYSLPSIYEDIPRDAKKWDLHQTVRAMFLNGEDYRTTPQYEFMLQKVEEKASPPPQGCRTAEEVDQYFERLIHAFHSMKKNGYLTQEEQGKASVSEIRLHITREGALCLGTGGNHRIRMAEILGVQCVPFLLRGVHPQWVIHLSKQLNLPPHKAIAKWMLLNFHCSKPSVTAHNVYCTEAGISVNGAPTG